MFAGERSKKKTYPNVRELDEGALSEARVKMVQCNQGFFPIVRNVGVVDDFETTIEHLKSQCDLFGDRFENGSLTGSEINGTKKEMGAANAMGLLAVAESIWSLGSVTEMEATTIYLKTTKNVWNLARSSLTLPAFYNQHGTSDTANKRKKVVDMILHHLPVIRFGVMLGTQENPKRVCRGVLIVNIKSMSDKEVGRVISATQDTMENTVFGNGTQSRQVALTSEEYENYRDAIDENGRFCLDSIIGSLLPDNELNRLGLGKKRVLMARRRHQNMALEIREAKTTALRELQAKKKIGKVCQDTGASHRRNLRAILQKRSSFKNPNRSKCGAKDRLKLSGTGGEVLLSVVESTEEVMYKSNDRQPVNETILGLSDEDTKGSQIKRILQKINKFLASKGIKEYKSAEPIVRHMKEENIRHVKPCETLHDPEVREHYCAKTEKNALRVSAMFSRNIRSIGQDRMRLYYANSSKHNRGKVWQKTRATATGRHFIPTIELQDHSQGTDCEVKFAPNTIAGHHVNENALDSEGKGGLMPEGFEIEKEIPGYDRKIHFQSRKKETLILVHPQSSSPETAAQNIHDVAEFIHGLGSEWCEDFKFLFLHRDHSFRCSSKKTIFPVVALFLVTNKEGVLLIGQAPKVSAKNFTEKANGSASRGIRGQVSDVESLCILLRLAITMKLNSPGRILPRIK